MLTIHVWPRWLKNFLLTHPLYKSPMVSDSACDADGDCLSDALETLVYGTSPNLPDTDGDGRFRTDET